MTGGLDERIRTETVRSYIRDTLELMQNDIQIDLHELVEMTEQFLCQNNG